MSAIGPGDWVECVGRGGRTEPPPYVTIVGNPVRAGSVHQVREVSAYPVRQDNGTQEIEDGLKLVGTVASAPGFPDGWWPAAAFRPIYRPKSELIETLLKQADEPVKEDA